LGKAKRTCVVIFASEDMALARELVAGLRGPKLNAWWSEDINQGDWESQVRAGIDKCDAVIPLVTQNTRGKTIFIDEWRYAESHGCPILGHTRRYDGIAKSYS
jgi:hypothetical protein